jgi:hypothetical protein
MKKIILIVCLLMSLHSFAQYECSVFNPANGNDYKLINATSEQCDSWFNENKNDGSFQCALECTLVKIDKSAEYQAIQEKRQIQLDIKKGESVIAHVVFLNNVRNASDNTKIAFLANAEVKQAKDLLSVGRISLARSVIANATADGSVITEQLKTDILAYIDSL